MIKGILTAIAMMIAGTACAQDITIPMHRIGAGSTITIQANTGEVFTHHMLGQTAPGRYVYETYRGYTPVGPTLWVHYTDAFGNLLQRVDQAGRTTTWAPHRCNRTLGACSYTETRHDGLTQPYTRVTNPILGGFSYQVYNGAGIVTLSGQSVLNELGWTQWGSSQAGNNPQTSFEILSAHYR